MIHDCSCFMLELAEIDSSHAISDMYGSITLVIQSHGSSSFLFYRFGYSY